MNSIERIQATDNYMLNRLIDVWESSVRETHTFLSTQDIQAIMPDVKKGLIEIEDLYVYKDENELLQGFIGVQDEKIEMLFIDADFRGCGIGKKLLQYVLENFSVKYVDVNEQNTQAVGFYKYMGFDVINRSAIDSQGRPFPILHLKLNL